jgi:hypothetical protein
LANTADIQNFVIQSLRSPSTGLKSLRCLTGQAALAARQRGLALCESILTYQAGLSEKNTWLLQK